MADNDTREIRITDPYVTGIVAKVREQRHGDGGTATKTAAQLILERYAQIEAGQGNQSARRRKRPA